MMTEKYEEKDRVKADYRKMEMEKKDVTGQKRKKTKKWQKENQTDKYGEKKGRKND